MSDSATFGVWVTARFSAVTIPCPSNVPFPSWNRSHRDASSMVELMSPAPSKSYGKIWVKGTSVVPSGVQRYPLA